MSAYMVVLIKVENTGWAADYAAHVPAIVRRHGGDYLAVTKGVADAIDHAEGTGAVPDAIVVIRFPTRDAANAFLAAPDYEPYKAARLAGTKGDMFVFENDDDAPQFVGQ